MPPNPDFMSHMGDINRSLGELAGGVSAILRELDNIKEERREHDTKVDTRMNKIENDMFIVTQVSRDAHQSAASAVSKAENVQKTMDEDIKPETDKIKNMNWKIAGFLTGISIAGTLIAQPVLAAVVDTLGQLIK